MKNSTVIKELLEKGKIDSSELSNLEKATYEGLEPLLSTTSGLSLPDSRSKLEAWQMLEKKIKNKPAKKVRIVKMPYYRRRYKLIMAIAATVSLLLVVGYFVLYNPSTVVYVPKGVQATIYLPDNSKVVLNAESKIKYAKRNWLKDRRVSLKGEAMFEVKEGSKFTVTSESGIVEVLGTSFNIYNRKRNYEVKCFTGKVGVIVAGHEDEPKVITAGGAVKKTNEGKLTEPYAFKQNVNTWQQGESHFQGSTLSAVFDEMERQFDIEIEFLGDTERTYSGYFKNKNLEDALKLVCKPMGLKYKIDKKAVTID